MLRAVSAVERLAPKPWRPAEGVFQLVSGIISHSEVGNATKDNVAAGCDVLLQAMIERANAPAN